MTQKIYIVLLALAVIFLGVIAIKPSTKDVAQKFGVTSSDQITNWIGGAFSGDLSVGGDLSLTETSISNNSKVVVPAKSMVITATTATTTPCAVQNNSGVTRTLIDIGVTERGTSASLGAIRFKAGTSTTPYKTTYYTYFLNGALNTKVSGVDSITTTSSLMTAYSPWRNGEYLVFYSATTVHAGTCRVAWY